MENEIEAAERVQEKVEEPKESKLMKDVKRARLVLCSDTDDSDDHRGSSPKSSNHNGADSSFGKKNMQSVLRGKRNRENSEAESSAKRIRDDSSKAIGGQSNGNVVQQRRPVVPAYRLNDATIKGVVLSSPSKASKTVNEDMRSKKHLGRSKDPLSERKRVVEKVSTDSLSEKIKSKDAAAESPNRGKEGKHDLHRSFTSYEKAGMLSSCEVKEEDVESSKMKLEESISSVKKSNELKSSNFKEEKPRAAKGNNAKLRSFEEKRDKARSSKLKTDKLKFSKEKLFTNKSPNAKLQNTGSHAKQDEKLQKHKSHDVEVMKSRNLKSKDRKLKSDELKMQPIIPHGAKKLQIKSKRAGLSSSRSAAKYDSDNGSDEEATCHNKEKSGGPCSSSRADKQKLREQIKTVLLSAGWKIDLRPRKGRDYEDQVYVSPQGTGYWSITKAFAAFEEQIQSDDGRSMKGISVEALDILKRNVVKKRRDRKECDYIQNKVKDGRRKRQKLKDSGGRKKMKVSSGSSTKAAFVSNSKKVPIQNIDRKQRGCTLLVRGVNQEADADFDEHIPYIWKRTVLSWMIDLGIVPANGKVKYISKKKSKALLEGRITRDGIHCSCCSKVLTVSRFEVHAGSKMNQPYENTIVEETGMSLLESQLQAWENHEEPEKRGFYTVQNIGDDPNDDTCGICGDGGDLICCDSCPSTFHLNCLDIQELPQDDWHCMYCSCKYCRSATHNALGEKGEQTVPLLSCLQCEEKYHVECIPEGESIPASSSELKSFCGRSCRKVFKGIEKLIGVKNDLDSGFTWTMIHSFTDDWTLMNCSLPKKAVCNSKVAVAFSVMDECFLPSIDQRSGINLIHNIIYSCRSNFKRLNYHGFYTFILERGEEIVCVASVRIHGTKLAEMPYIGTRNMYRRQGMCRRLLNGIEEALYSLRVQKLIIPAISELADAWISAFGFKPIEMSQKQELLSTNILVFPSAGLLQKILFKGKNSLERFKTSDRGQISDVETWPLDKNNVADGSIPSAVAGKLDGYAEATSLTEEVTGTALSSPCLKMTSEPHHNSEPPSSSCDHMQTSTETDAMIDPSEGYRKTNAQSPVHDIEPSTERNNNEISTSEDGKSLLKNSALCTSAAACTAVPHGTDQVVKSESNILTSGASFGNGSCCVIKVLDSTDNSLCSSLIPGTDNLLNNDPLHKKPQKEETFSSPENKPSLKHEDSDVHASETNKPFNGEVSMLVTTKVEDIVTQTEDKRCHKDEYVSEISEATNVRTRNGGLSDDSPQVFKGTPAVQDELLHKQEEGILENSEMEFNCCSFRRPHQSSELIGTLSIGSNSDILSPSTVGTSHPNESCSFEMMQGGIHSSSCVTEKDDVISASGFSCGSKPVQIENASSKQVTCKVLVITKNKDFEDAGGFHISLVKSHPDSTFINVESEQMLHQTCVDVANSKACPLDDQAMTQVAGHLGLKTSDDSLLVQNNDVASEINKQKSKVREYISSPNGFKEGSCPASENDTAK